MEIGLPTNVKHVTHIGFDGTLTPTTDGCNHLAISEFLSLCPDHMAKYKEHMSLPMDSTRGSQSTSCN